MTKVIFFPEKILNKSTIILIFLTKCFFFFLNSEAHTIKIIKEIFGEKNGYFFLPKQTTLNCS